MSLKLRLVRNGEVLCEFPLSPDDWNREELDREFRDMRRELRRFLRTFDVFTNENRIKMLQYLLRDADHVASFTDFMENLNMNPKSIREHAAKLREVGFLDFPHRGRYRLSERGRLGFMMTNLAVRRFLSVLAEEYKEV